MIPERDEDDWENLLDVGPLTVHEERHGGTFEFEPKKGEMTDD